MAALPLDLLEPVVPAFVVPRAEGVAPRRHVDTAFHIRPQLLFIEVDAVNAGARQFL